MKISHPVYDMLNIMCSDFHGNILKDVEYITKSVRGLVRSFGQCIYSLVLNENKIKQV